MTTPTIRDEYRARLLPLLEQWTARRLRLAIFGTGPHTDLLFDALPELEGPALVAFLDSDVSRQAPAYRGRPVHPVAWADDHVDIVLCSSFTREWEQALLLDSMRPKVVVSHRLHAPGGPALMVPVESALTVLPATEDASPFDAVTRLFEAQAADFVRWLDRLRPFLGAGGTPDVGQPAPAEADVGNPYFSGTDARVAYAMVRTLQPRTIVEVGCGHSTRWMRRAIADAGTPSRLVCIDPAPRVPVATLCDEWLATCVQRVPLGVFDALQAGDILFIDGSHLVFQGSDCAFLYLRVLPRLRPGVLVHAHDITLPAAYPEAFASRFYNEQHLVAALLLARGRWRACVPVAHLSAIRLLDGSGSSLWMTGEEPGPVPAGAAQARGGQSS
jgi:hypothetical protein